jgi:pimeloyl-ACP methyl ester carboxylesterase
MRSSTPAHRIGTLALALGLLFGPLGSQAAPGSWQGQHDQLVARLRALEAKSGAFGPAYAPLYRAAIPWYERWGGRNQDPVDANMVSPEAYAGELADALEKGRNFIAENPGALFPLAFEKALPGGRSVRCNYWLSLPRGFPDSGGPYPLQVGLHGSGWLAHKISFVRGKGDGGPLLSVTPIDEGGPWQIDFLNAYLDELESMLPVDIDRVYLEGHSLGAEATWEWALANPERFAAIAPMDGRGEPYRAVRLRHVPAWVIHGERDNVIYSGHAEQMITAMRAAGGTADYLLIPNAPHNIPADFDHSKVVRWYLEHRRSHEPAPADPRDSLGLNPAGFSEPVVATLPGGPCWSSGPIPLPEPADETRAAEWPLFKKVQSLGTLVSGPIAEEFDPVRSSMTLWIAVPPDVAAKAASDPTVVLRRPVRVLRFIFRGTRGDGLAHARKVAEGTPVEGLRPTGRVWVTPLSLWQDSERGIARYEAELGAP